jgi:hypothetical protein
MLGAMGVEIAGEHDGREARARRAAALEQAELRFPDVAARFESVYGLPLPRHLRFGAAFFLGLSAEESEVCHVSLAGFASWFWWLASKSGEPTATLDGRLEGRFRSDPPEFVTIASGAMDGSHWGLFYDEPGLPTLVAHGFARDDGVVRPARTTLLASIRSEVNTRRGRAADDARRVRAVVGWLDALRPLEDAARAEQGIAAPPASRIELAMGGVGAHLPGWSPPQDLPDRDARWEAYVADAPAVATWIARADQELARGNGGLALVLGRELHHADRDPHREACTRLLVGAYEALGRAPLAGIARVHHANRDLRSVTVYVTPEEVAEAAARAAQQDPPIVRAAFLADAATLERELSADPPPSADYLARAVVEANRAFRLRGEATKSVCLEILDRLLSVGGADVASRALRGCLLIVQRAIALDTLVKMSKPGGIADLESTVGWQLAPRDRTALDRVIAAGAAPCGPQDVYEAVASGLPDVARWALAAIPPDALAAYRGRYFSLDETLEGASLLHIAVCTASPEIVTMVLDRGVDPAAKDAAGHTPRALAKMLWSARPSISHTIVALIDARTRPAVATPPAPAAPSFGAGAKVSHPTFGAGVITKIDGSGDGAKVTVTFAAGTKVLQRRFLTLV